MKVIVLFLALCLTMAQLIPFVLIPWSVGSKVANGKANISQTGIDPITGLPLPSGEQPSISPDGDNKADGSIPENPSADPSYIVPVPDTSEELTGYCTFMYESAYFNLVAEETTDSVKEFKFKDQKSRVRLGFVTDLDEHTDVPGYIMQGVAGIPSTTNDKKFVTVGNNDKWQLIKAKGPVNGLAGYVLYLESGKGDHAIYARITVAPESDNDNFWLCVYNMCATASIYYQGKTVFDTPDSGWYAQDPENPNGDSKPDQGEHRENDDGYTVYQNEDGFVATTLPSSWDSLAIEIAGKQISLPCTVNDVVAAGFSIDDTSGAAIDDFVLGGGSYDLTIVDDAHAKFKITARNTSETTEVSLGDCNVVNIEVIPNRFIKYAECDWENGYVVLPGGVTVPIYVDALLRYYGTPNESSSYQDTAGNVRNVYTWASEGRKLTIEIGAVVYITKITMSCE